MLLQNSGKLEKLEDHFKIEHSRKEDEMAFQQPLFQDVKVDCDFNEEDEIDIIDDEDKPKEYEKRVWGENGDGYSYLGKQKPFTQAVEGLKDILKMDSKNELSYTLGSTRFTVLKSRKIPYGNESTIEVEKGDEKGNAVLKFFGPNTKKEYKITISKSKGGSNEHVQIASESVVSPLLKSFLLGQKWGDLKSVRIEKERLTCDVCNKDYSSERYLKVHKTRMHKTGKLDKLKMRSYDESKTETKLYKCDICTQTFLNKNQIVVHKTVCIPDKIELHEKEITRTCDDCDSKFPIMTQRQWIQRVQLHKVTDCPEKSLL